MSAHNDDRYIRTEYSGTDSALLDALRVLDDLERLAAEGELLIPVNRFEFLARRARRLVRACLDSELTHPHQGTADA